MTSIKARCSGLSCCDNPISREAKQEEAKAERQRKEQWVDAAPGQAVAVNEREQQLTVANSNSPKYNSIRMQPTDHISPG